MKPQSCRNMTSNSFHLHFHLFLNLINKSMLDKIDMNYLLACLRVISKMIFFFTFSFCEKRRSFNFSQLVQDIFQGYSQFHRFSPLCWILDEILLIQNIIAFPMGLQHPTIRRQICGEI